VYDVLPYKRRVDLAVVLVPMVLKALGPYCAHTEVLKVQFQSDSCPKIWIVATAVIIEPHMKQKFDVAASAIVAYGRDDRSGWAPEQPLDVHELLVITAREFRTSLCTEIARHQEKWAQVVRGIADFHALVHAGSDF